MLLWKLEFKKMFMTRGILLFLIVFLIVNGAKIYLGNQYEPKAIESRSRYSSEGYDDAVDSVSGKFTDEKAVKVVNGHDQHIAFLHGDCTYSRENENYYAIYDSFRYQYEYHIHMNEKLSMADENISFFKKRNNAFCASKNELFRKVYSDRYISDYHECNDMDILLSYDFSSFLLLIMSFVLSMRMFFSERQSEMGQMLKTTRKGKNILPYIKITAFAAAVFISSFALYLEDVVIHSIMFHLDGWSTPIYSVQAHEFNVFGCSILTYYSILCVIRWAALFVSGLLLSAVSMILKGKLMPIVADIMVISACIAASENEADSSLLPYFDPAVLLQPNAAARSFNIVSLFGRPILSITFICFIIAGYMLLFAAANVIAYRNTFLSVSLRRRKSNDKE